MISTRSSAIGSTRSPTRGFTRRPSASSTKPSPRRKPALKALPLTPYRTVLKLERRVSHEGMVSVGGNLYSVPDTTRRRILDVHVFADEICIFEDGVLIATHVPLEGRDQKRLDPEHRKVLSSPRRRQQRWQAHPHSSRRRPRRSPLARLLRRRRSPPCRAGRCAMNARVEIVPSLVERIKQTMVGLKMPRAIEILDATVRRLERGEMTALEAIDALLAEEFTLRENRRVKTALVMARLSAIKTLAGFDFSFQPSLDKNRIMALAELSFIDRAEVLHLVGPPGTGKSHLSLALGVEAVKAGRSVYFSTLADLVGALAKAEREGTLREKIRFFCRFALLIVDEIGYLPVIPGGGNLFFQLVNARYEKGAMILTSNRGFAEWGEVLATPSSPRPCWTGFFTTPSSSRSRARAIACASTPISCQSTSERNPSSSRRRSRRRPSAAAGRQKTEEPIIPTADHHARQSGEFCAPQTGEIPRPVDNRQSARRNSLRRLFGLYR